MESMRQGSKKNPRSTKIYVPSRLLQPAKKHADRNGFTLSGWIGLLLKKALGPKKRA